MENGPIRELTFADRAKWGTCPVCDAKHGEPCNGYVGIQFGHTVTGKPVEGGAHLGRLQRAPTQVREIAIA